MDLFLDRQLSESDAVMVEEHLESCEECRDLLAGRRALRARVQSAIRNDDSPADLAHRIQFAIGRAGTPRRFLTLPFLKSGLVKPMLALAALVLVGTSAYYFWPDRAVTPKESQAEFIARATRPLAPLMRVGFQQHLHCGVFREYPAVAPALADLAREKLVSPALIDAVETHAPWGLHVVMAHLCSYKDRDYTHVVARGHGHLMSLLITKRLNGEEFSGDLKADATQLGFPVFGSAREAGQDSYSIDAFETSGYVVFLISDESPAENLNALLTMSGQVRAALL